MKLSVMLPSRKRLIQIAVGLAAAAVLVPVVLVVFILPHIEIAGAADPPPVFEYIEEFGVEKTTPEGVKYTVNNSVATFALDVAKADAHCRRVFKDYASALEHCKNNGLAAIPSVQLVQGKCKQFDDGMCAALELAVQNGLREITGKRAALTKLARRLVSMSNEASDVACPAIERALVHVAAALSLGRTDIDLPPAVAAKTSATKGDFLARLERSRPIGFWTWNEGLKALFMQDRFLTQGLRLSEEAATVVALSVAISGDTELASAFGRFNRFDAKITNPLTYVDQDKLLAPQARCVLFGDVAALLPADVPVNDALASETVTKLAAELKTRFGEKAGFALVAYSESKEYGLLQKVFSGNPGVSTMNLIIDAVKSGRLSLEPKPESGWYDYQWHALETLLLPERARESAKLKLSEAYKERLKNAFAAILTKHRETHIKRLPVVYLGMKGEWLEPPPEVEIGPEFSVEPTSTVYLRMARGYAFLRNALHAVLGQEALRELRRFNAETPPVGTDLDAELRETTLRLYGLYERLCVEIGQRPDYLEGELSAEETMRAKQIAAKWLASLADDPDLAADTRVVAPIAYDPIASVMRSWATGGVKLQRVAYEYRDEPRVGGRVEPVFVPTHYYLATDIFLEFDRPGGAPLTRKEFRALCDAHDDEVSLRRALGAIELPRRGGFPYVTLVVLALVAVGLGALGWKYRSRLRALDYGRVFNKRNYGIAGIAASALVLLWVLALLFSQGYRTRFLVKYVARIHPNVGLILEGRFFYRNRSPAAIDALIDLLADPHPQVRYLAARFLGSSRVLWDDDGADVLRGIPDAESRLRAAADEVVYEEAAGVFYALGCFRSRETVDFLLGKLEEKRAHGELCGFIVYALGETRDARALEAILTLTSDRRLFVRMAAVRSLSKFGDERAARRIIELVGAPDQRTCRLARSSLDDMRHDHPAVVPESEADAALVAASRNPAFSPYHREDSADEIADVALRVATYVELLGSLGSASDDEARRCREHIAWSLGDIGPDARAAIPALKECLSDPDGEVREAAKDALEKIESEAD